MAEAFGIGAGIVGVIGLAIQITQVVVQFGLDWKDAPHDIKTFLAELQTLNTVLSVTNTNIILNPDFAEAFQNRPSILLSQLGPGAPPATDTKLMLEICKSELEDLLSELKKRAKGHRVGWERVKGAFLAKNTRESVGNLHRQCQTLNNMVSIDAAVLGATTYKEVKEARTEQQEARKEQQEWYQSEASQMILTWLTTIDYGAQQSDFLSRRQEGTGRWLLDSHEFQTWSNEYRQALFCSGMPGTGKTIMVSIVADYLCTKYRNDNNIGIAYLYCSFRRQHEQRPVDLLASLLKQFIRGLPVMPESMKNLYKRHMGKQTRPSLDEISKELHSVVADYSKSFIIIDALDECQVSDGGRQKFLSELLNLQAKAGASLFATSRFIPEITKEFVGKSVSLEIRASEEDVRRYLDGHMAQLPSFVLSRLDLREEIKTEIVKAVDGMFLLGQLHLGSLIGKRSPKALQAALKLLPTGSNAYDHAYKEAMERIEDRVANSQVLAKQVLSWITCAKRPLSTLELRHALAIEIGTSELDKENLPTIEDMISVCAGLVTVDEQNGIIRLVHYTAQEYFERTQMSWFPKAQREIAMICVTYLSFNVFEAGFCPTDREFEARLQLNPLYDYAARYWGHHARAASAEVEQSAVNFLESEAKVSSSSQAMTAFRDYFDYSQRVPKQMTGLHLAAYFGLREAMIALLKYGHDPDSKDNNGQTPLSWAAANGNDTVVKLLLEKGAELESKNKNGQTPLLWAVENGHEAVIKLLLKKGADLESKDNDSRTPLWWAAKNGRKAVVKLLLERGVRLEGKDKYGRTPLLWAAANGHEAVVKLLLEKGAELESKDSYYSRTPLSWAAANGHEAVVKLLLERDAKLESKNKNGQTPLLWAVENGHEAVVKLLLKKGADLESKDKNGQTALLWAAENRHEAVMKLLLEKGADLESKDKDGQTPLLWAASNGHEVVVKLLLEKGADLEFKDNDGRTSLSWAAARGHKVVVKLLLEKSVELEAKDKYGQTPLLWAAARGHEVVVKLLLEKGAELEFKDKYGWTPLLWAAAGGHETVVKLLFEKGAELESKDNEGRTPLSWAAARGRKMVVKLLLERSVELETKDKNGQTPLLWAAARGHEVVVKLLLEKGAELESKDKDGRTPLSWAAVWGRKAMVKLLLEKGAELESKDNDGRTPLWWAAENGRKGMVKLLLEKTAEL